MSKSFRFLCVTVSVLLSSMPSFARGQEIDLVRAGLVYAIGQVQRVASNSSQIDLGDVHTLRLGEKLAIFRATDNYYVPIGVVTVRQTFATYCQTTNSPSVHPEIGDIAIFPREFSQLKTAADHRDDFARLMLLKNSGSNRYSTLGDAHVAEALSEYSAKYGQWERSKRDVVGYMFGRSFIDSGEQPITPLLRQINMMREIYRAGRKSLPAAGEEWAAVITLMSGPTVRAQHLAAQKIVTEDEFVDDENTGPPIRGIQRQVRDTLFDKLDEEQKLATFLVARILEASPPNPELWFSHNLTQSQFPLLAQEPALVDQVRKILQVLRSDPE